MRERERERERERLREEREEGKIEALNNLYFPYKVTVANISLKHTNLKFTSWS